MKSRIRLLIPMLVAALVPGQTDAQNPALRRMQQQQKQLQRQMQQAVKDAAAAAPDLPSDPELLSLHKEFIVKAEKLAKEYERKKNYDAAREVFEAINRLVPKYPEAEEGVKRMLQLQAMRNRKITEVKATESWQDSGAVLQKGMPVHIEVKGTWKVVLETGPEGFDIPDKLWPRDSRVKIGSLIGVIVSSTSELDSARPFLVQSGTDFVADKSGKLYLRMFDTEPADNEGRMLVMVQSTFAN